MKKCPYCSEEIQDSAIKCKHCGEWLENPSTNNPDAVESLFKAGKSFLEKQVENYKKKRYAHLYEPTDDRPLLLGDFRLYKTSFAIEKEKHSLDEIFKIHFRVYQYTRNSITVSWSATFHLYYSRNSDDIINQKGTNFINLSNSRGRLLGITKKESETLLYIHDYIERVTFKNRLSLYLQSLAKNDYFKYPEGFHVYNNGDLRKEGKLLCNIKQAKDNSLLEYGMKWSGGVGSSEYDPYSLNIYHSTGTRRKILGIELGQPIKMLIYYDKDCFDAMFALLLKNGKIL